jgi:hypothetical protein
LASLVSLPALRRAAFTCACTAAAIPPAARSILASFRLAAALRFALLPDAAPRCGFLTV